MALSYGERDRTYLLHIPPQGLSGRALPVVLNFHGGGGHATQQQEYTELDTVADREGFYTVYPNGTGRMSSHFLTWNAGNCCGYAKDHKIDDVGFSQALLSHLSTVVPIDHTRIYATGLSNGAMMAYRLAAEASDLVAAIAPVAGSMMVSTFAPSHAVPVMHVHSLDDPRAPYEGGEGPPFPLTNRRVTHPPVESQLHRWVERNQCQVPPAKRAGPVSNFLWLPTPPVGTKNPVYTMSHRSGHCVVAITWSRPRMAWGCPDAFPAISWPANQYHSD